MANDRDDFDDDDIDTSLYDDLPDMTDESPVEELPAAFLSRLEHLEGELARDLAKERASRLSRATVPRRPQAEGSLSHGKVKAILDWQFGGQAG